MCPHITPGRIPPSPSSPARSRAGECPGGANNMCSGHGACSHGATGSGKCTCDATYFGPSCASRCAGAPGNICSGHGTCNAGAAGDGTCSCEAANTTGYWAGSDCSQCQPGWAGPSCVGMRLPRPLRFVGTLRIRCVNGPGCPFSTRRAFLFPSPNSSRRAQVTGGRATDGGWRLKRPAGGAGRRGSFLRNPPPLARATPFSDQQQVLFPQLFERVDFGGSFVWWSLNIEFFLSFGAGDGIPGILITVLPPTSIPSCPLEVETGEPPDDECIHDATGTACVFLRAPANPVLVSQISVFSVAVKGGGRGGRFASG